MATNDEMNKYDSAAIGATTAGLTTFAILANRMRMEQELFNKTNGARGINWSADAKAVDAKLKEMPKEALNSFKQNLSDSVTSATGKVKDVLGIKTPPEPEDPTARYKNVAEREHAERIRELQKSSGEGIDKERVAEGAKTRRETFEKDKPLAKPKFKIPKYRLGAAGLAAGAGAYMNQKGKDLQASDSRGFERIFDDIEGRTLENISPLAGVGTGIAAGLATNEAITRKLRGMYDPDKSLDMNRRQAYGRLYDDITGQTADYLENKKNKLKLKRAKTATERAEILADQEAIRERAKERYTSKAADDIEAERVKTADRDRLTRQVEMQKRDFTRDTTIHNTIRNNINSRITDLQASLESVPKGASTTQASDLNTKIKDLESLRTNLDSVPEHELKAGKATKYKDFDPGYVQEGVEEVKQQSKKAKRKAAKAAKAAAETVTDTAQTVADETKSTFQKAKQKATTATDYLKGKVGLSKYDTVGPTQPKKGMSYYNRHPFEAVAKAPVAAAKLGGKAVGTTAKVGGKALAAVAPGNVLNLALKTKRDLEEQGVSPIVKNLIDSGASESEINEAIREDMYATAFANTGIPEMAEQVADWASKDMSMYDRAGDVAETSWDIVKGMGEGIISGGKGMADLASRTYDWATGEDEFGALYDDKGKRRDIAGYDEDPVITPAPSDAKQVINETTAPSTENSPELNVRKKAEDFNKRRANAVAKQTELNQRRKFGGYTSGQDYAKQFEGVEYVPGGDNRYGNTPIYKGKDEFGNISYSDVPTNVMDPSKYDVNKAKQANVLRSQQIEYQDAAKKAARESFMPSWARGTVTPQEWAAMAPKDRLKGAADAYKARIDQNKADNTALDLVKAEQAVPGSISQVANIQARTGTPTQQARAMQLNPQMLAKKYEDPGMFDVGPWDAMKWDAGDTSAMRAGQGSYNPASGEYVLPSGRAFTVPTTDEASFEASTYKYDPNLKSKY